MRIALVVGAFILAGAACAPAAGTAPTTPAPSRRAVAETPSAAATTSATTAPPAPSPTAGTSPSASPTPALTPAPTASATAAVGALPRVRLTRAFTPFTLRSATGALQLPDGSWLGLEQAGRIVRFRADGTSSVFIDLGGRLTSGGETGLLGLALAPDFATSGIFFVDYTAPSPLRTIVSSFTSANLIGDPRSEAVLLTVAQPFTNHNGGQLAFGPDGYLYVALGDGGSGGDPQRNGQNTNVLLGKILRLDVRDRTRYAIPADNPFASGGGRPEIWAYGLRNPWRFSFDLEGGALWAGDVGQNTWEEIDLITRGGNYGWNVMEGLHCYGAQTCNRAGLTLPVFEYDHAATSSCSITGGFVYRGTAIPALRGAYVYGDYCSGKIWGLRLAFGQVDAQAELASAGFAIGSFAQSRDGEIYVLEYGAQGRIFRLEP